MTVFVTADHHFNHKGIIKYCKRPFASVSEMNEFMINTWNKYVGEYDIVIHLGDFGFGTKKQIRDIRNQLNGLIFLIKGSHDSKVKEDCGFFVRRGAIQIGKYVLSHKPLKQEDVPEGKINVHGHIHEKQSFHGINVSVERTNYKPIKLEEISELSVS